MTHPPRIPLPKATGPGPRPLDERGAPAGHAVVIGAGLAGLTAAAELSRAGARVTVVEAGAVVGGRLATLGSLSLTHQGREFQFPLEHGLHGFWRQYRNLRRLIASLNRSDLLRPSHQQELLIPNGAGAVDHVEIGRSVRASRWPSALALGTQPFMLREVVRSNPRSIVQATADMSHVLAFDQTKDIEFYSQTTVAEFVRSWPPFVQRLFAALTHSGFFVETDQVSLAAFLTGLGYYATDDKRNSAFDVMTTDSRTGLLDPLCRTIEAGGGRVLLGTRAVRLQHAPDGSAAGVLVQGSGARPESLAADAVVVALDPPGFRRFSESSSLERALGPLTIPRGVPSVVVRMWFTERPPRRRAACGILDEMEANAFFWLDSLQRPFEAWRRATGGGVLECHLYGQRAVEALGTADRRVVEALARMARRAWPGIGAPLTSHVQRNAATHVAFTPDVVSRLPQVRTRVPNLALCGDWIQAPYPSLYLERACLTGLVAARTVAPSVGICSNSLPDPLPPYPPSRSVGLLRPILRALRGWGLLTGLRHRSRTAPRRRKQAA